MKYLLEFKTISENPQKISNNDVFVIINSCEGYTAIVRASWDENEAFLGFIRSTHSDFQFFDTDSYSLWARLPDSYDVASDFGLLL
jgi:hypothetical protein